MKNGTSKQISRKTTESSSKGNFNIAFTLVLVTVGIVTYQLFTPSNTSTKAIAQEKKVTKIEEKKTEDKETAKIEEKKTEDKETAKIEEKKTEDKETAKIEEKKNEDKEANTARREIKNRKIGKTNGTENNEEEKRHLKKRVLKLILLGSQLVPSKEQNLK